MPEPTENTFIDVQALLGSAKTWHYGWQWRGPEPVCGKCTPADCGLVARVDADCLYHHTQQANAKQLHAHYDCPAAL